MKTLEGSTSARESARIFEAHGRTVAAENVRIILDRLWESGGPGSTPIIITRDISVPARIISEPVSSWRRALGRLSARQQVEPAKIPARTHTEQVAAMQGYLLFNHYHADRHDRNGTVVERRTDMGSIVFTQDGRFATDASEENTYFGGIDKDLLYITPKDGSITIAEDQLLPIEKLPDPVALVPQLVDDLYYTIRERHGKIGWHIAVDRMGHPDYDEQGHVQLLDGDVGRPM